MLSAAKHHWLPLGLGLSLPVLFSFAMFVAPAPYLHDYAEWLYQSEIVRLLMTGSDNVDGFRLSPYPVPYSLLFVLLGALATWLPVLWAGKLFLIGLVFAWAAVLWRFSCHFSQDQKPAAMYLVTLSLAGFSSFFWTGFISYQLGLLILCLFLSQGFKERSLLAYILYSCALFFSHAMVFLVFLLLIGIRFVIQPDRRIVIGLVPAAVLSGWYLAGRWSTGYVTPQAAAGWSGWQEVLVYKAGYPAMIGPFRNFLKADGSSLLENLELVYYFGFTLNFLIAAVIGLGILFLLLKFMKTIRQLNLTLQVAYVSLGILSLLYLVAPYEFFGLTNPGGRLLIPMLLLATILAGKLSSRGIRLLCIPVFPVTVVCIAMYTALVSTTHLDEVPQRAGVPFGEPPANSVMNYNDWVYSATRYRYFNYRIFAMTEKFNELEDKKFQRLGLDIGLIHRKEE